MSDYFKKAAQRTQPIRDAFNKQPSVAKVPVAPKAPVSHKGVEVGKLQGESLGDWQHMQDAVHRIGRRLAPKSAMGKSSPKR